MATLPTVPTFVDGDFSLANLQNLSYAVSFISDDDVRPLWHIYSEATQGISANAWTAVNTSYVARDSDGVASSPGVTINTQGYYAVEACIPFEVSSSGAGVGACFQVIAGPNNPNHSPGATQMFGPRETGSPDEVAVWATLCPADICPWELYPGDQIVPMAYSTAALNLGYNTNAGYREGRFVRQFTGLWIGTGAVAPTPPPIASVPVGCTLNLDDYSLSTYTATASTVDGYVGYPIAATYAKIYESEGTFGSTPGTEMTQLAALGCKFLISFKPTRAGGGLGTLDPTGHYGDTITAAQRVAMANYIAMLQDNGIEFDVCLWQEMNVADKSGNLNFTTPAEYAAHIAYYAPVICDPAAYWTSGGSAPTAPRLIYDPGYSTPSSGVAYWPGDGAGYTFYAITCDFYSTDYVKYSGSLANGSDPLYTLPSGGGAGLEQIADTLGKPFGLAEWGNSAGKETASNPYFSTYTTYIADKFAGRIAAGKPNYILCYYNSTNAKGANFNTVLNGSDPKVAGIRQVCIAAAG